MPDLLTSRRRKSPVIKKLEAAAPAIRSQFGVTRIGIFGSFARGEQTRKSDVDVLVDFPRGMRHLKISSGWPIALKHSSIGKWISSRWKE